MATMEQVQAQAFTDPGGILAGYKGLIQPQNVPTGKDLVPDLYPEQVQGANLLQTGLGSYQPYLTAGGASLQSALGATGPGAAASYMNPYLQQVADTTMTDLQRQFGNQQAQMAQRQIGSGSFAGSATRGAIEQGELARQQGDVSAKALSGLYAGGYESALKAAQTAAKTQAGIGQLYGGLGQQSQQGLFGDVGQLFDMGESQRQILGAQNLAQYQTPFYGLQSFANVVGGMPTPQQFQSPNPILTGIAAAGSVGNLFGS